MSDKNNYNVNINLIWFSFYQSQVDGSLDECKELFITLRSEYAAEYTLYGLEAIAIPLLLPKVKNIVSIT
jgi:hypothetical protein